ncbi:EamA family transporter [Arachidicoccus sp.]|uniref:EamA family transporter n=1 Tax=Arachidicoccus sp. TaxID=1872624 RepID=UPI003D252394
MIKNSFYILLAGCSFGILSTIVKIEYGKGYTLGDISGAQALFGAIILWLFFIVMYKKATKDKSPAAPREKNSIAKLLATGAVSGLISICYYKCVHLIPASIAIILLMQYTWMSMLIEKLFFKSSMNKKQILCVGLILIGTILAAGLLKDKEGIHPLPIEGIVYGLLGGLFYAIFIIANGRVGNHFTSLKKSSIISIGMCIMVFAIFPPSFIWNGTFSNVMQWGFPLAIFGTVLPPILFAIAIPRIGIPLSSILSSVELPTAVILAYFILKEDVDYVQVIGILLILSSIVIINVKDRSMATMDLRRAE